MTIAQAKPQPLEFLKLLAHDIRWQILLALSKSDYRVNELVKIVKEPANLISYHLKSLRTKDLVSERRSSCDSRDIYYSLNLDKFRRMYFETGQVLHPALGTHTEIETKAVATTPARVLFLCTHNSARSQMAEALLRKMGGIRVEVFSAGSEPTNIHPLAIKVMSGRGIDLSTHRSKHLGEFAGQSFDYVISVCDKVREVCPVFPGNPEHIHWSFPDPVAVQGTQQTQQRGFEETARGLTTRIQYLLLMIDRSKRK